MKIPLICMACVKHHVDNDTKYSASPILLEFNDKGVYEIECEKGHKTITFLQEQKFEILFDIGAYAILDGYYREAVSSFAAALERFYEFSIRVLCLSKNISWEDFSLAWKDVAAQSERQLGAFIFLYLQEFHSQPRILKGDNVKFRNEVVHKGKIPTKNEAIDFGQSVLDIIRPILKNFKDNYSDAVNKSIGQYLNEIGKGINTAGCMSKGTILSITNGSASHDEQSLQDALLQLRYY